MDVVLKGAVGAFIPPKPGAIPNDYGDQALVTTLLYAIPASEGGAFGELLPLITSGKPSDVLAARIKVFQERWPALLNAEDIGVVRPRSPTLTLLSKKAPSSVFDVFKWGDYEVELTPEGVGDGHREGSVAVVDPFSLFSGQPMRRTSINFAITTRLVSVKRAGSRFWFGVSIPDGCTAFDRAHVYFHPTAKTKWYPDSDYADFTGNWRYLHTNNIKVVAPQVAAALKVPLIVPYLRNGAWASPALNPFSLDAAGILNAVMSACVRAAGNGYVGKMQIGALSISSFSAGIDYMVPSLAYLKLTGLVREVIDLDSGFMINAKGRLIPGMAPRMMVIAQMQRPPAIPGAVERPAPWWGEANDLTGMLNTHQHIFNLALFAALRDSPLKGP